MLVNPKGIQMDISSFNQVFVQAVADDVRGNDFDIFKIEVKQNEGETPWFTLLFWNIHTPDRNYPAEVLYSTASKQFYPGGHATPAEPKPDHYLIAGKALVFVAQVVKALNTALAKKADPKALLARSVSNLILERGLTAEVRSLLAVAPWGEAQPGAVLAYQNTAKVTLQSLEAVYRLENALGAADEVEPDGEVVAYNFHLAECAFWFLLNEGTRTVTINAEFGDFYG
ncbi:MAG: hypothetical protein AAGK74_00090 [Chloroflexota bacterium]